MKLTVPPPLLRGWHGSVRQVHLGQGAWWLEGAWGHNELQRDARRLCPNIEGSVHVRVAALEVRGRAVEVARVDPADRKDRPRHRRPARIRDRVVCAQR